MKNLDIHIESISNAQTIEDAFDYFCLVMAEYGYDQVAYSLITDHVSLGLPRMHGLATSYPDDWMKHYTENNYLPEDPVVLKIKKSFAPFFWDDLEKDPSMSEHSLNILRQGGEAGVRDGIGIPLYGVHNEIVGLGLARKEVEKTRDIYFVAAAQLLATHFHEKFRLLSGEIHQATYTPLSVRERDVLSWAAEGKENGDIAYIMGISQETVKTHLQRCYKKLRAHGRSFAITKALLLGEIYPQNIMSLSPERVIAGNE
jgi:DNA-binding CsgD family transcriptional regulator